MTRSKNPKRFTPKRAPLPPQVTPQARKAFIRQAPRKAAPMQRTGFRG